MQIKGADYKESKAEYDKTLHEMWG